MLSQAYITKMLHTLGTLLLHTCIATGVPGMVGGMLRHMKSLRSMRRDNGWIHTLLEEAENERMHLLTFLQLRQPGFIFRGLVLLSQVLPLHLPRRLSASVSSLVPLHLLCCLLLFSQLLLLLALPCPVHTVLPSCLLCRFACTDVFCLITLSLRFLCLFSEEPV